MLECKMQIGEDEIDFCATYYRGSIDWLLAISIEVGRGSAQELAVFEPDPGVFYFRLTSLSAETLRVDLAWFEGYFFSFDKAPFEDGELVFEAICSLSSFLESLEVSLRKFIKRVGLSEYKRLWGATFPMEELDELKQVVDDLRRDRALE